MFLQVFQQHHVQNQQHDCMMSIHKKIMKPNVERAEACLHLRESHALAKDVVRKADFYRRCLFERCKVGKCLFCL